MTHFLLAANDDHALEFFAAELGKEKLITIHHAHSGREAFSLINTEKIEVVIAAQELGDSDGLTFVKKLARKHPLINCAMVSALPPDEFHEETEGLGLFMQLPQNPGAKEVARMMEILKSIDALMAI
jgi:DNA-binding NarL/FixJ family response regulator